MRLLSGSVLLAADLLVGWGDIGDGNADSEVVRDECSCTLAESERRYSINEFDETEEKMLRGQETGNDIQRVTDSCPSPVLEG